MKKSNRNFLLKRYLSWVDLGYSFRRDCVHLYYIGLLGTFWLIGALAL